MLRIAISLVLSGLFFGATALRAQQPANHVARVPATNGIERIVPPVGLALPSDLVRPIVARLESLQAGLRAWRQSHVSAANAAADAHAAPQLPRLGSVDPAAVSVHVDVSADIAMLCKAVDFALRNREVYSEADLQKVDELLTLAETRWTDLQLGRTPWRQARGLVVRGFYSRIDETPQPYGLVIPENWTKTEPVPLYVWLHGRGDKSTDLHFLHERLHKVGQIEPNAIVLHPFGRQCLGYKAAGETDVLEAIAQVRSEYNVDPRRIVLMGFSMGGAGAWHLGAHYTDQFVAVSPGAGFAETAEYNRLKPSQLPADYERMLWGVYDVPDYARNLLNTHVIVYSGENDKQIQAAQVMQRALREQGHDLRHVIGPGMGHQYHPDSLAEIMSDLDDVVRSANGAVPTTVHLQTRTLRYPQMHWVRAEGLEQHWVDARIDATLDQPDALVVVTKNVSAFTLAANTPLPQGTLNIDGSTWQVDRDTKPAPWRFANQAGVWQWRDDQDDEETGLHKRPYLQGPIDDAFMERFLVVRPTGNSIDPRIDRWVDFELQHLRNRWCYLFRGTLPEKMDVDVTDDDIRSQNLIVWGTPESNSVLARIIAATDRARGTNANAKRIGGSDIRGWPLVWNQQGVAFGDHRFTAANHVPILIYPNPLRPDRYVVLNSGPTFRDAHDRTNSLQNPKLPDWAVLDIRVPPNGEQSGAITDAGFFDESWQVKR